METTTASVITVEAIIDSPVEKVWEYWTGPAHVVKWNHASDDWHTTRATNDLRIGGTFSSRMEAKDGSMGFDFEGVYDDVRSNEYIEYSIADGRKVKINFKTKGNTTIVTESFDAEPVNAEEIQKSGWQAIIDNFKKYVETLNQEN